MTDKEKINYGILFQAEHDLWRNFEFGCVSANLGCEFYHDDWEETNTWKENVRKEYHKLEVAGTLTGKSRMWEPKKKVVNKKSGSNKCLIYEDHYKNEKKRYCLIKQVYVTAEGEEPVKMKWTEMKNKPEEEDDIVNNYYDVEL